MANRTICNFTAKLTGDPKEIPLQNGDSIFKFTIANNDRVKKAGEWVTETTFLDCQWYTNKNSAAKARVYLKKGVTVSGYGSLQTAQWEDPKTGEKKTKVYIKVFELDYYRIVSFTETIQPATQDKPLQQVSVVPTSHGTYQPNPQYENQNSDLNPAPVQNNGGFNNEQLLQQLMQKMLLQMQNQNNQQSTANQSTNVMNNQSGYNTYNGSYNNANQQNNIDTPFTEDEIPF